MTGQIDLYGVFVPASARLGARRPRPRRPAACRARTRRLYRLVWHRPLFDLALYVVVLGLVVHLAPRFVS